MQENKNRKDIYSTARIVTGTAHHINLFKHRKLNLKNKSSFFSECCFAFNNYCNIVPELNFLLIFLGNSYSRDCFSILLFTIPTPQSHKCTSMQTNTTGCYGIFPSNEWCGVELPDLRLAARSVLNFAFFWHAKKSSLICKVFRGEEARDALKDFPWCRIWCEGWKSKCKY